MVKNLVLFTFLVALVYSVCDLYSREAFIVETCQASEACKEQLSAGSKSFSENMQKYYASRKSLDADEASGFLQSMATGLFFLSGILLLIFWKQQPQKPELMYWASINQSFVFILLVVTFWSPSAAMVSLKNLVELLAGLGGVALLYRIYLGQQGKRAHYEGDYSAYKWFPRLAIFFLSFEVVSGGWLSGNMAGYGCPDLMGCLNNWMSQLTASTNDAALGQEFQVLSSAETRETLHWFCRGVTIAALVVIATLGLLMRLQHKPVDQTFMRQSCVIAGLFVFQLIIAEWAVHLNWSIVLPVIHHVITIALFLLLINLEFHCIRSKIRRRKAETESVKAEQAGAGKAGEQDLRAKATVAAEPALLSDELPEENLLDRLKNQLGKTRSAFGSLPLFGRNVELNDDVLEEIEDSLLMADVGMEVTRKVIDDVKQQFKDKLVSGEQLQARVRETLLAMLEPCVVPLRIADDKKPFVILVVGVNGAGKTTTIGKLAKHLQNEGKRVMLAAGDTFRAAAVEQLKTWGERNDIPVIAQQTGADSASVIFDGIESAKAKGVDVLIADTAGRLHTKSNLMTELSKIKRIMAKLDESAPHEVLLVLDAGTGQNAITQATQFNEAVQLTGLVLTKLDGTAKGGVMFGLAEKLGVPIRFIGIGEGINDLREFEAQEFIDAILPQQNGTS